MYAVRKDGLGWRAIGNESDVTDDETFSKNQPLPTKTLDQVKSEKFDEIRVAYNAATLLPVETSGITWDGGFDSAIKLDAAMRLSQAAGAEGVRFYDTSNVAHDLDFVAALQVCIAVAVAYQTALGKKQELFAAINAATTKTQVGAISW